MQQQKLLAAILCAATPLAYAASSDTLDEVVVTATRVAQPLKQSLSSTTVITQEDIRNSQATDVATILRGVAGVEFSQNGGIGKATSLFLRGSESTQVLVLLDGVRINSATMDTTAIQDLMLDQIERIEVVRGNVSSLYGSEAIGGVVQIFTKKGSGTPRFNASAGAGSLNTQRAAAGFGGSVDNTDFHLQVSSLKTDGVSALNPAIYPSANPDADGYRNTSVSANVRHAFNSDHSVSASLFNSLGYNQYDSASGPPTDANTNTQKLNKVSLAVDDRFTDAWQSHLQYAQGVDEYHDYVNGAPVYSFGSPYSLYKTTNRQLTWQNTLQASSASQLLLGAENLVQNVDSDVTYTVTQRTVNSLFAGYTGNYGAHQVQANLRQDNNSQYGTANTGLLGYGFSFDEAWRATANYSSAFRAPTFNDLYYPGYGDANLKPEYAHNAEIGLHYGANDQRVDAVYFDNRTHDLIIWGPLPTPPSFYGPSNVNQARVNGMEITYGGQFGDTGVKASLTSQNPRDETAGQTLVRRAKFHSSVALSHRAGAWQLGGEWLHSGEREDDFTDPNTFVTSRQMLAAYNVLNLTAAYAINKELKLAMRADNLTDQNDATAYGYNPLGRTLFVGLNYQQ